MTGTKKQLGAWLRAKGETGCTTQYINLAIREGHLSRDNFNGATCLDFQRAYEELKENTRLRGKPAAGKTEGNGRTDAGAGAKKGNGEKYSAARARRESALADKAELDAARLRRDLIPRDLAEKTYRDIFRGARANLEAVGAQIAPLLQGKTDLAEIRKIVNDANAEALNAIPDRPPTVG